tara:strand:+ start:5416 stop:5604 length:189 start_codon:yes stop_codon:yes gene_type:complete
VIGIARASSQIRAVRDEKTEICLKKEFLGARARTPRRRAIRRRLSRRRASIALFALRMRKVQ